VIPPIEVHDQLPCLGLLLRDCCCCFLIRKERFIVIIVIIILLFKFLGFHFFLVSANLAWRAKGRERETGIKSGPPFPIKKKKKKRKKREVQTKVPVSEDVLVHQVASGLVLGGESKLLDRRVLLQGLDKHALRLAGDGLSLVSNPQLLDSVVLQQNLGQGLKTGATDAMKKKIPRKEKERKSQGGKVF